MTVLMEVRDDDKSEVIMDKKNMAIQSMTDLNYPLSTLNTQVIDLKVYIYMYICENAEQ